MFSQLDPSAPPSKYWLMLESRAIGEFGLCCAVAPLLLQFAPSGDGHPVLVLPGFIASDLSTKPLRMFLRNRGYQAHGWSLGTNLGPREGVEDNMRKRLESLAERYGQKVSVIGWSLGGIFARELARQAPELVRSVITLGSPFAGEPHANHGWKCYEKLSGRKADDWPNRDLMKQPPPVPATAIYTRTDGVVNWQGCLEQMSATSENIEVESSHCGLAHHPAVMFAIADRLAQAEGQWRPFDHESGLRRFVYRDPNRGDRFVNA
ncbi:esterase/lipase family protein [Caballeronia grimmiae]|uniref:Alpha/beta hydrolase n=1 Tax=Caballeronia grimmiae TaxID=1071679 RepID=A0A069P8H8_9BURK|nr:alpha/beta hydrolase [Caballeronia grimmiae]KDR36953.1 alpha/beta hydrolase [Caballeronia grimmiae]GGD75998.1 alpha/beta hydrolase [Caballeronia grimmiae]